MSTQVPNLAAIITGVGEKCIYEERPIPSPNSNEVVVRSHALAINPIDWKRQKTGMMTEFPAVLGNDFAGVVVAVGSSVTKFSAGDRVVCMSEINKGINYGAFQTYVVTGEICVCKIPDSLSFEEAAVLPTAVATTTVGLFHNLGLPVITGNKVTPTQSILIWGGASSVGTLAIQFAKAANLKVFAVASKKNHGLLQKLGADAVFDYNSTDVVNEIVSAAGKAGVPLSIALDCISEPQTLAPVSEVMKQSAEKGTTPKVTHLLPLQAIGYQAPEGVNFLWTNGSEVHLSRTDLGQWLNGEYLPKALESGEIVPTPELHLMEGGIKGIQTAIDFLFKGVSAKKVVIKLV